MRKRFSLETADQAKTFFQKQLEHSLKTVAVIETHTGFNECPSVNCAEALATVAWQFVEGSSARA